MLATEILIGFCPTIAKHCFYALTDFPPPPPLHKEKVELAAGDRA